MAQRLSEFVRGRMLKEKKEKVKSMKMMPMMVSLNPRLQQRARVRMALRLGEFVKGRMQRIIKGQEKHHQKSLNPVRLRSVSEEQLKLAIRHTRYLRITR